MSLSSKIFWGQVQHFRKFPRPFSFTYRTFSLALDLDEFNCLSSFKPLFAVDQTAIFSIRSSDYLSDYKSNLRTKFNEYLLKENVSELPDKVFLITMPRFFGYVFNPVNFYLGFTNEKLSHCLAEVNNTFNETKRYLMTASELDEKGVASYRFPKKLFVSPFFDRVGSYRVEVSDFSEALKIVVRLINESDEEIFFASLAGSGRSFSWSRLLATTLLYPFTVALVMARIHWQAFKLYFFVKAPIFVKPEPLPCNISRPAAFFQRLRLALVRTLHIIQAKNTNPILNAMISQRPLQSYTPFEQKIFKTDGIFGLGEAFISETWQPDDLRNFLSDLVANEKKLLRRFNWPMAKHLWGQFILNPQRGSGAYEVAKRHYDLGNDLFEAMLDSSMTYTCGFWREAENLAQAQEHKLRLLCEKLMLRPGMTVLDIGCGWGNFAYHAAKNYGVNVVGLTVSKEQAQFAQERCANLPVQIILTDYQKHSAVYDCIVSIEMIEAVGKKNIANFYDYVCKSLKPGGLFALQVISADTFNSRSSTALNQFILYLVKYIFPNGYLPNNKELVLAAGKQFVIEDLHNFSADYVMTLAAWEENFINAWPSLAPHYDEEFYRIWRFYLCGCMAMFNNRIVQLYQIVYSKGGLRGGYNYRIR